MCVQCVRTRVSSCECECQRHHTFAECPTPSFHLVAALLHLEPQTPETCNPRDPPIPPLTPTLRRSFPKQLSKDKASYPIPAGVRNAFARAYIVKAHAHMCMDALGRSRTMVGAYSPRVSQSGTCHVCRSPGHANPRYQPDTFCCACGSPPDGNVGGRQPHAAQQERNAGVRNHPQPWPARKPPPTPTPVSLVSLVSPQRPQPQPQPPTPQPPRRRRQHQQRQLLPPPPLAARRPLRLHHPGKSNLTVPGGRSSHHSELWLKYG